MQDQINKLQDRVTELENMLSILSMPLELKENIRNQVIVGEDSSVVLTQSYSVVASAVDAPVAYTGTILLKNRGNEYVIGYLSKR